MKPMILLAFWLVPMLVAGQVSDPEFTAIAKKFEKKKFESALESAEALMDNDKHRKKPEPYLWASMCFYEISKSDDPKTKQRYRSALRNALKNAGRAVGKDKNGNIVENNRAYFDTMKREGIEYAQQYLADDNVRKASYTYKQILKFAPDDPNVRFAKAVTDIKMNNYFDAERDVNIAFPELEKNYRNFDFKPDPISSPILKDAVIFYIGHLMQNSYVDSAKAVALSARIFFPLDTTIIKLNHDLE